MVDASGTTLFQYDNRNRLIAKATPQGTLVYGYNASGQVTNITSLNTNGVNLRYGYDELNRLNWAYDPHSGITSYSYDDVGNLNSFLYPNGVGTVYDYSSLKRLTNMNVLHGLSNIASYTYTVAPSGHRIGATETILRDPLGQPTTLTRLYAYDRTYRLTNETIGGTGFSTPATLGHAYDKVGNRLQLASTLGAISSASYTYDANDRPNTSSAEQFDSNGNTLFASGFGMTQADQYDFENRLIQRTETGKTIQIVYDGDGNRVKKTVTTPTNTVTTWFLVDMVNPTGYAQVLEEHVAVNSQPSAITRVYAYGHDLISQDQVIGSQWQVSFYGYDGHGNTRFLTDVSGAVTDTYDYDAFGNLIASTGSTPNHYFFTGEQFDSELGLYFLRARYHDVQAGRFWTMDVYEGALADPQSLHKYLHVAGDPVNNSDPSGNFTVPSWAAAMTIGALVNTIGTVTQKGFWNQSDEAILRDLGISVATGAAFGIAGGPAGKLVLKIFGQQITPWVLGGLTGAAVGSAANVVNEVLDIVINKKQITGTLIICGTARTFVAGGLGFVAGGFTTHVQTTRLVNSSTITTEYRGLPFPLSSFPKPPLNYSGITAIGAGDLFANTIGAFLETLVGCE